MQQGSGDGENPREAPEDNHLHAPDDWSCYKDDDIIQQQDAIHAEEALKLPLVGDKETLSSLADEYQSGNPIIQEKIKILAEKYGAMRRTRGDGNCFFRAFMFSYLEHLLETQDKDEVCRISRNVEQCKKTLQSLGYADFTFEDFFALFMEQLESVMQGNETSMRFVTSGEIRRRLEFFEPFVLGLSDSTIDQFCKTSVEPMGAESDHVQIIALSDALGVPVRVVYLDRSSGNSTSVAINHHDFIPSSSTSVEMKNDEGGESDATPQIQPIVTLLYRPGHYDILYAKWSGCC